jgi:hypothetical protein
MMPMRLGKVIERMLVEIEAARRHGMWKRLPEMRSCFVDERDTSSLAPCKRVAQARGKFQSRSTTTDDNDFVKSRLSWAPGQKSRPDCDRSLQSQAFRTLPIWHVLRENLFAVGEGPLQQGFDQSSNWADRAIQCARRKYWRHRHY